MEMKNYDHLRTATSIGTFFVLYWGNLQIPWGEMRFLQQEGFGLGSQDLPAWEVISGSRGFAWSLPWFPECVRFSLVWRQRFIKEIWEVLSSQESTNCRKGREEEEEEGSIKIHSVEKRFKRVAGVSEWLMQYMTSPLLLLLLLLLLFFLDLIIL